MHVCVKSVHVCVKFVKCLLSVGQMRVKCVKGVSRLSSVFQVCQLSEVCTNFLKCISSVSRGSSVCQVYVMCVSSCGKFVKCVSSVYPVRVKILSNVPTAC